MATATDTPLDPFALGALQAFYRLHAPIYDLTRPLILRGRRRVLEGLAVTRGQLVLDVGCGTGFSLPHLHARGAEVVGIEPSAAMRARAERQVRRCQLRDWIRLDSRPYGSHDEHAGRADRILLSYSLSMIPCFEEVLQRARADLRPGGRIGVVDFLSAWRPVAGLLTRSHVFLGGDRFSELRRLFPRHSYSVYRGGLWSYYLFWGEM
jgi:S-adenosylmethionine-diacylgycerolhomoserine-N-methlytransferase